MNDPRRIAGILLAVNALAWLGFGVSSLVRMTSGSPNTLPVISILMFGDFAVLLACAIGIQKYPRAFYWVTLGVLALNAILSITDDFGLPDLLILLLNMFTLGFLLATRKNFIAKK